jgi:uncharacterized protein (TIGR00369 family)
MLKPNPEFIEEAKRVLNTSPFPKHMSMELVDLRLDGATVTLKLANNHLQAFGIVHGGVLATLVDTATFWAVFLRLPDECGLVNIDLKLNYLKPALTGRLTAQGRAIRSGKSISYAEANVLDEDGQLLVHGTSTLMSMPGKGLPVSSRKFL